MKFALAAAATVALLAVSPASAAKMMSCAGDGPMKVQTMVSGAPYMGPRSDMVNAEIAKANMAMSKGNMGACNRSLMRAQRMQMGMMRGMM